MPSNAKKVLFISNIGVKFLYPFNSIPRFLLGCFWEAEYTLNVGKFGSILLSVLGLSIL